MSENALEVELAKFMRLRGWRRVRNQIGVYEIDGRTQKIGTPGFPDWTFKRSIPEPHPPALIEILHVETKAKGAKPTPKQLEQIALLNYLGEPAVWIDNMEKFEAWYSKLFSQ